MTVTPLSPPTEQWVTATWEQYLEIAEHWETEKAKFYYNNGQLRIEITPLGNDHASDHSIINYAIHLYASLNGIELNGKDNCTYRKTAIQATQPDLSYYIGETVNAIPYGTGVINLDQFPPPTLAIEIANTSLADDKGEKRLLYEDLAVQEYWIVDVQTVEIIAFAIAQQGSHRIRESNVLPHLSIPLLEQALQRTRTTSHSRVSVWLLEQFQSRTQTQ